MNLTTAWNEANDGDKLKLNHGSGVSHILMKNDPRNGPLDIWEALSEKWEIIRAEPKPETLGDLIEEMGSCVNTRGFVLEGVQTSWRRATASRDLIYKPLLDKVREIRVIPGGDLDNILLRIEEQLK